MFKEPKWQTVLVFNNKAGVGSGETKRINIWPKNNLYLSLFCTLEYHIASAIVSLGVLLGLVTGRLWQAQAYPPDPGPMAISQ